MRRPAEEVTVHRHEGVRERLRREVGRARARQTLPGLEQRLEPRGDTRPSVDRVSLYAAEPSANPSCVTTRRHVSLPSGRIRRAARRSLGAAGPGCLVVSHRAAAEPHRSPKRDASTLNHWA